MKTWQIVVSIVIGLAAGCIPIVKFNIGAHRKDSAQSIFTRLLIAEALIGVAAVLAIKIFPSAIISILGVSFVIILPQFFGLEDVLSSMPVSDVLTFLISLAVILKTYKELKI